jgi:hypothetical protein
VQNDAALERSGQGAGLSKDGPQKAREADFGGELAAGFDEHGQIGGGQLRMAHEFTDSAESLSRKHFL